MKITRGSRSTCMGKLSRPDLEKQALNEIFDNIKITPVLKNNNATHQSTNFFVFLKTITGEINPIMKILNSIKETSPYGIFLKVT